MDLVKDQWLNIVVAGGFAIMGIIRSIILLNDVEKGDGFGCGDSDTQPEIYVHSSTWEALRISSPLMSPME